MSYWIAKINLSKNDDDESPWSRQEVIEADDVEAAYKLADAIVNEWREDYEGQRNVHLQSLRPYSAFVAVFDCRQGYGGPEEGGWWYDYGNPDVGAYNKMRVFEDPHEAAVYLGQLREDCDRMNVVERRYKHSAADTGWYDAFLSFEPPTPFPENTPRYE